MKMRYLVVPALLLALVTGAQAYDRTVMVEYFSNYACGPCGAYYGDVINFLSQHDPEEAAFMIYHMNWPSTQDWYYVANPSENNARRSVYGVDAVPWFEVDGQWNSTSFTSLWNLINSRIGQYTPVEIVLDQAEIGFNGTITVQITINSDQDLAGYRLYTFLTDINCQYGPAPNGIQNYRNNMLDMSPGSSGVDLGGINGGGSDTFNFDIPMWDDHPADNYGIVAFVQHPTTHVILQAMQSFEVQINYPSLSVVNYDLNDDDQPMPNGRPDPGETVEIVVTLQNQEAFLATDNLVGTLTCSNETIEIMNGSVPWLTIVPGTMMSNAMNPFVIHVPDVFDPEYVTFHLNFLDGSGYELDYDFLQLVGSPRMAIVDDSPAGTDLGDFWFDTMLESGQTMDIISSTDAITNDLSEYHALVWATSNATTDVLNVLEVGAIQQYLQNGGHVLLTGENIGEFPGTAGLLQSYFMSEHGLDEVPQPYDVMVYGIPDGPFPGSQVVIYGEGGANTTQSPSSLVPLEGGVPFFKYIQTEYVGGIGYIGEDFASVYLPFNLEAVSNAGTWDAAETMSNLLNWMDGITSVDEPGGAEAALPSEVTLTGYPNPFNAAMMVSYALPRASDVQLAVYNLLGREVAELTQGRAEAGIHQVSFDASSLSSGVYFLSLRAGSDVRTQKIVLMK